MKRLLAEAVRAAFQAHPEIKPKTRHFYAESYGTEFCCGLGIMLVQTVGKEAVKDWRVGYDTVEKHLGLSRNYGIGYAEGFDACHYTGDQRILDSLEYQQGKQDGLEAAVALGLRKGVAC